MFTRSQLIGWQVRTDMRDRVRGYRGIKLRRPRRTSIGYKFGGRDTQQRVHNYMATNPAPLPPIEVSFNR